MDVTLLGTGAAWPDAHRSSPAFLVQHNGVPFLIDCGGGTCHQLMKVGVPPSTLDMILLTHTHIDHCVELPALVFGAYLTGKEGGFHVFGAGGTEHFARSIFHDTYSFAGPMMKKLRNKDISIIAKDVKQDVFHRDADLTIEATPVDHGFPTVGFRFVSHGRSIVFSGDTAPCDSVVELARDADLFIVECSFPEHVGPKPGHCIPSQVGKLAAAANVKRILLVHLFPSCRGKEDAMISDVRKEFSGPVEIGYDLQKFTVA